MFTHLITYDRAPQVGPPQHIGTILTRLGATRTTLTTLWLVARPGQTAAQVHAEVYAAIRVLVKDLGVARIDDHVGFNLADGGAANRG